MHHFRVLLPEGAAATREGIQLCLDQLDLGSEGYQVGRTMVKTIPVFLFQCFKLFRNAENELQEFQSNRLKDKYQLMNVDSEDGGSCPYRSVS